MTMGVGGAQAPIEWSGVGWTDSSWDLARGLVVVEDLPPEAWPAEMRASMEEGPRPALS